MELYLLSYCPLIIFLIFRVVQVLVLNKRDKVLDESNDLISFMKIEKEYLDEYHNSMYVSYESQKELVDFIKKNKFWI